MRRAPVRHQGPPPDAHAGRRRRACVPGIPEELDRLILQLLAPDPADRPADAAVVSAALARLLTRAPEEPFAPAGLVGRAPELERLRKALTQAWTGAARTVVVAGEPGIGKTTLLDALATEAGRRGGVAVWGRGEPEGRAYGVWRPVVRALAQLVAGERRPRARPAARRGRRPAARSSGCGSTTRSPTCSRPRRPSSPLLVVLDDLHWADASSLRLLAHVASAEPAARLLLAGSYTASELAEARAPGVLDEIEGDPRAERMELAGLGAEAVRALLPSDAAVPEAILQAVHARTAGNPFYVAELVRLLATEGRLGDDSGTLVPARVREVVRRRVERLGAGGLRRARGRRRRRALHDRRPRARRGRLARRRRPRRSTAGPRPGSSPPPARRRGTSPSRTGSSATPCARRCPSSGAARCTRRSPRR